MANKVISSRPHQLVALSQKTTVTKKITVTPPKTTPIRDIEAAIEDSFFKTFKDFTNAKTFREQDFRNAFYHHLRSIFTKKQITDVDILSDHVLKMNATTIFKPDICLIRNDKPTVVIELKNVNIVNGKLVDYNAKDGLKDIEKMKMYCEYGFQKGYFIHLDKSKKEYSNRKAAWKDNFLRDFCFILDDDTLIIRTYKSGQIEKQEMEFS
jgi:hypothetical protein